MEIRGSVIISKWKELMKRVRAIKKLVKSHKLKNSYIAGEDLGNAIQVAESTIRGRYKKPAFKTIMNGEGPYRLEWGYEKS